MLKKSHKYFRWYASINVFLLSYEIKRCATNLFFFIKIEKINVYNSYKLY